MLPQSLACLLISSHQKHNDNNKKDIERGKGENDRVLPVDEESPVLLPFLLRLLLPFLSSYLWVDCRWDTGACQQIVGVILRTGVRWWAEALARLVIPNFAPLQAGGGGRGVLALAAAGLLLPLLVLRSAAGRLKTTPTPTRHLVLNLKVGALLLTRASTKGAPGKGQL